jgi:hypothetical protein
MLTPRVKRAKGVPMKTTRSFSNILEASGAPARPSSTAMHPHITAWTTPECFHQGERDAPLLVAACLCLMAKYHCPPPEKRKKGHKLQPLYAGKKITIIKEDTNARRKSMLKTARVIQACLFIRLFIEDPSRLFLIIRMSQKMNEDCCLYSIPRFSTILPHCAFAVYMHPPQNLAETLIMTEKIIDVPFTVSTTSARQAEDRRVTNNRYRGSICHRYTPYLLKVHRYQSRSYRFFVMTLIAWLK